MAINYYRLLGVLPDADQQRLRSAYRSLAKRFHPDTNNGCEASADLFRKINTAYQVLADPKLRAEYDASQPPRKTVQPAEQKRPNRSNPDDPQQKFGRFVDSLLDAIFGPAEQPQQTRSKARSANRRKGKPRRKAKKPDFSFYYHLEKEKRATPYEQGADGIYRPQSDLKQVRVNKRRARKPGVGGQFVLLLIGSLWNLWRG